MWNGIGWYGFIGVITTSTTDISLTHSLLQSFTVKTIDKAKILMTNGSLMKVKSIAECSRWSMLQYF